MSPDQNIGLEPRDPFSLFVGCDTPQHLVLGLVLNSKQQSWGGRLRGLGCGSGTPTGRHLDPGGSYHGLHGDAHSFDR